MGKNLILAIVVSFFIITGYSLFMSKFYPQHSPSLPEETSQDLSVEEKKESKEDAPDDMYLSISKTDLEPIKLGSNVFYLDSKGGYIHSVECGPRLQPIDFQRLTYINKYRQVYFNILSSQEEIELKGKKSVEGIKLEKKIKCVDEQVYQVELTFINDSGNDKVFEYSFVVSDWASSSDKANGRFSSEKYTEVCVSKEDRVIRMPVSGGMFSKNKLQEKSTFGNFEWIGLRGKYFCVVAKPLFRFEGGWAQGSNEDKKIVTVGVYSGKQSVPAKGRLINNYLLYVGPLDKAALGKTQEGFESIISFGFFGGISEFILKLLAVFHIWTGSWGWSIVLLSVLIFAAFFPLTLKSAHAMRNMQVMQAKLKPELDALREKYKSNPSRMQKETMELYKKHDVNPMKGCTGGCLPMLFQLPIFIALFQALTRSVKLQGADFLWIKDLSLPDRAFHLPVSIPILGEYINILPILMIVTMFIQQKLTAQETAASKEQQKMMQIIFPIFFGVIFYSFPSGLVLYYFMFNIFNLIQRWYVEVKHRSLEKI